MLGKIKCQIEGVIPMIMDRDTGDRSPIKDPGSPENRQREFKQAQYVNSKGKLVILSEHLEKCFEVAGNQIAFKGKQKYGKLICGGLFVEPQEVLLKVGKDDPKPFSKMVRIPPRTGSRVLKTRAKIDKWSCEFMINVVNDDINFDALKEVVTKAGIHFGLLAWRPKYGRFDIVKFEKM